VRRGVTQLLGLLFPSAAHKLEPLEAVLVYQHLFVLKCLMENVTRVQDYVQEQFEEEFRLVIGEAVVQVYLLRTMVSKSGPMFNKIQVQ
jgi:hypothetical protein